MSVSGSRGDAADDSIHGGVGGLSIAVEELDAGGVVLGIEGPAPARADGLERELYVGDERETGIGDGAPGQWDLAGSHDAKTVAGLAMEAAADVVEHPLVNFRPRRDHGVYCHCPVHPTKSRYIPVYPTISRYFHRHACQPVLNSKHTKGHFVHVEGVELAAEPIQFGRSDLAR